MKILARDVIEEEIIHGREHMQEYDSFQFYENKRAMRVRRGGGDRSVNIRERKKLRKLRKQSQSWRKSILSASFIQWMEIRFPVLPYLLPNHTTVTIDNNNKKMIPLKGQRSDSKTRCIQYMYDTHKIDVCSSICCWKLCHFSSTGNWTGICRLATPPISTNSQTTRRLRNRHYTYNTIAYIMYVSSPPPLFQTG